MGVTRVQIVFIDDITEETPVILSGSKFDHTKLFQVGNFKISGSETMELIDKDGHFYTRVVTWKNNKWDGVICDYNSNGKCIYERNYVAGKLNGVSRHYKQAMWLDITIAVYFPGAMYLTDEIRYKDDSPHGLFKKYHENGILKREGIFKYGKLNGLVREYDDHGEIESEVWYKDHKKHGLSFHWSGGKKYSKQFYDDGKPTGPYIIWHPNGKIEWWKFFKDYKIVGKVKNWYDNGVMHQETEYKNGRENGLYRAWNEDESIREETTYVNGYKNGITKKYYPNGNLRKTVTYKNHERKGYCHMYSEDGKLVEIRYYTDDYSFRKVALKDISDTNN